MDIFEPCYSFQEAELVKASGLYPYYRILSGSDGTTVECGGKSAVMLGSNNYLGLTHHPEVLAAAHAALDRYGTACTGSRLLNGNLDLHETLEQEIAAFVNKEAALVFSSGFLANLGVVSLLGRAKGAILFSETENHASLIDGVRFAKADTRLFTNLDDLEAQLAERPRWEEALVVSDAVFSMSGREADVKRLVALKRRFGFRIYLDDAHGMGVMGDHGRGTAQAQGVNDEIDLLFGTFSKSFASFGGFVAGERPVIDYLRHHARTMIFSASLPPASVATALAALRLMQRDSSLFERLWENVTFFREGLQRLGYHTMGSTTPIVPALVGSESLAFRMCKESLDLGLFNTPAIFPAVPYGQALIRTSVTPAHTKAQLAFALEVFEKLAARYPIPKVTNGRLPVADAMDFSYLMPDAA